QRRLNTQRSINKPLVSAYVFAAVIALSVGYFIAGIPIQLTDSLENIMGAQRPMMVLLRGELGAATSGYVRPLLSAQIRLGVLLSHGHYFATFKAIQIAQLIACALLLVRLVRPIDWPRAIASALGVAVLFGAHTFTGTITE